MALDGTNWVIQNEPHPRFPVYTRGNAGEVFPNVVTPLTGSLFNDAVRAAQRKLFGKSGAFTRAELSGDPPFTGFFGGYLYINMSLARLIGVRSPGFSPEMVDTQLFGVYDAPPYRAQPGDRRLRTIPSILRRMSEIIRTPPLVEVEKARAEVEGWVSRLPVPSSLTDAELVALIRTFPLRIEDDFRRLLEASNAAAVGRALTERLVSSKRRTDGQSFANRLTAGLGTIDSARLALGTWDLGRLVEADPQLTAHFDAGLDGLLDRLRADDAPPVPDFVAQLDRFLADHGHRCTDEYELANPSWAMDPRPALATIDRLRLAPAERSPHLARQRMAIDREAAMGEALGRVPRPLRRLLHRMIRLAAEGAEARERIKDVFVKDLSAMRRVIAEVMDRVQARGGPSERRDCYLAMVDELPDFLVDPSKLTTTIADREAQRDRLQARVPPFWFDGVVPPLETWDLRSARPDASQRTGIMTGIGVCNGVATGPARVVLDPNDPRGLEPGDVLVAPITDPAWTPLFLGACAVVVDVGAQLSHAAIVARELGIPAVVSVTGASRSIADGTMLRVDGDRGEVTILGVT